MKSLKIDEKVHKDLKVFAAKIGYSIEVVATQAIMKYVIEESKKQYVKNSISSKK